MTDYRERIRALRALAEKDSGATEPERELAKKRADELEAKYFPKKSNASSPSTNDKTVEDLYWWQDQIRVWPKKTEPNYRPGKGFAEDQTKATWDELWNLAANQYMWNTKYYDKDGTPKPGYGGEEDIVEDAYREEPDEDYGYDIYEGEE